MSVKSHYETLFAEVEARFGALSRKTLTAIVGFSAGGPVSVCRVPDSSVLITCELSLHPEQVPSAEGLRYELLSTGSLSTDERRSMLTALGEYSLEAELGDGHTVQIDDSVLVELRLFSETKIDGRQYGVYEVVPVIE